MEPHNQADNTGSSGLSQALRPLCMRPRTYTPQGRFEEVVAWLSGWSNGLRQAGSPLAGEWDQFLGWLAQRLDFPAGDAWFLYVRDLSPDDDQGALQLLWQLYEEYSR